MKKPKHNTVEEEEVNDAFKADSVKNKFAREYRTSVYVFTGAKTV